jgi:PPOX class probable F420-dependent enzyme
MLTLDAGTTFGARVVERLAQDEIIWLTTISASEVPQPVPVWFLWDGDTALIYTAPETYKLRNIARNSKVSLNLNSDPLGGDIAVFVGTAWVDRTAPPPDQHPGYLAKYGDRVINLLGMTLEDYAILYPVALRVRPTKARGGD